MAKTLVDILVTHNDELVDYISGRFGNRAFAYDVVQETCVRILQKPVDEAEILSPIAFLKTMSFNIAINYYRQEKTTKQWIDFLDDLPECDTVQLQNKMTLPELEVAKQQREQQILAAIKILPEVSHDVFVMTQLYHLSQIEVAEKLNISRGMVTRHLARALKDILPVLIDTDH